jgi:hypothetical protein
VKNRTRRLLSFVVLLSLLALGATDVHAIKRISEQDAVLATGHSHLESDPELGSSLNLTGFYFSPVAKKINSSVEACRTETVQPKANTSPVENERQVVGAQDHLFFNFPSHHFW